MKIAINGTFWDQPNTGSGQYVRELVPELMRLAPENQYAVIRPSDRRSFNSVVENIAKVWFEQVGFARACRRERATLAHVPYFASPFFAPAPTVVTIHDLIPILLPLYRGSPLVRLYTRLVAAAARRASAVIADSECTRRDIVDRLGIPQSRVDVVYLAANARYQPTANTEPVRRKYGLPEKFLLYLGGFDQRKNVRVIVEAFAHLSDLYAAGYRLALAGVILGEDSAFFPNPQRIARQAGLPDDALCLVGRIAEEDKPALYSAASVFLFPSLYEGFGLPPLEAMACGAPVVASNAASLPEIVGSAGILAGPHDARAWADAIRAVVTDPVQRAEMRERGLAQAAKFSWTRAARETLDVYASVRR